MAGLRLESENGRETNVLTWWANWPIIPFPFALLGQGRANQGPEKCGRDARVCVLTVAQTSVCGLLG